MFGQEREDKTRDVVVLLVKGKMAGIEQMDFGVRHIALERIRTGSDERGIVPPTDDNVGGLRWRNHACHAGYEATFVR